MAIRYLYKAYDNNKIQVQCEVHRDTHGFSEALLIKLQSETDPGYLSNAADDLQVAGDQDDRSNIFQGVSVNQRVFLNQTA